MKMFSRKVREEGKTIGLVPTMGYLHEGHLSLIRASGKECDVIVVSLFVNPTQFGPKEDFNKYPRDNKRDISLLEKERTDVLFMPSEKDIYPEGPAVEIRAREQLANALCGASRPGHFDGVVTVVAKLFDIVNPDAAYFGQKDAQQVIVIKGMVDDLKMDVDIRTLPIVREKDGLAMSSRNTYLSADERQQALSIFRGLEKARENIASGERSAGKTKEKILGILSEYKDVKVDYVEVVDAERLTPLKNIDGKALIAVAAFVGNTRLIDNILIGRE